MYACAASVGRLALCQMSTSVEMSWDQVASALARWHDVGDRSACRAALTFLESEFRAMVPPVVRRTWPADQVVDILRDVLRRLLEQRCVPTDLRSPRGYFRAMLRTAFIEEHRQRLRRPEELLAARDADPEQIEDAARDQFDQVAASERSAVLRAALTQLSLPDRVALKLEHDPDWLDAEEAAWLAARNGCSVDAVVARASPVRDMYEITKLFDPGDDDPSDGQARRKRMERFRKRRDRARDELLALLKGKIE
jgi:DNA-directed RNA polymerase specialized sigma24 family protein